MGTFSITSNLVKFKNVEMPHWAMLSISRGLEANWYLRCERKKETLEKQERVKLGKQGERRCVHRKGVPIQGKEHF